VLQTMPIESSFESLSSSKISRRMFFSSKSLTSSGAFSVSFSDSGASPALICMSLTSLPPLTLRVNVSFHTCTGTHGHRAPRAACELHAVATCTA
jgi:hypothetical protein